MLDRRYDQTPAIREPTQRANALNSLRHKSPADDHPEWVVDVTLTIPWMLNICCGATFSRASPGSDENSQYDFSSPEGLLPTSAWPRLARASFRKTG